MSRNTHNRQFDHEDVDLDTNIVINGSITGFLTGTGLHPILAALAANSSSGGQVKVSSDDGSLAWLDTKIAAGPGIALEILNPGADEILQIGSSGSGGTLSLGGIAGQPHVGSAGAVGTDVTASESDHQHPAQVLFTTASINDIVAQLGTQVYLRYDSSGLPLLRFLQNSSNGVQLVGPSAAATGAERYKMYLQGINDDGVLVLDAAGSIERDIYHALFSSDIGNVGDGALPAGSVQAYSQLGEQFAVTTSDATSTSTTVADVADLNMAVISGVSYTFRAYVIFQTAATTTGIELGISVPGMTYIAWNVKIPTSISAFDFAALHTIAATLTTAGIDAANTNYLAEIEGTFKPSSSGDFAISFATEVAASAVKVMAGSVLIITRITE